MTQVKVRTATDPKATTASTTQAASDMKDLSKKQATRREILSAHLLDKTVKGNYYSYCSHGVQITTSRDSRELVSLLLLIILLSLS